LLFDFTKFSYEDEFVFSPTKATNSNFLYSGSRISSPGASFPVQDINLSGSATSAANTIDNFPPFPPFPFPDISAISGLQQTPEVFSSSRDGISALAPLSIWDSGPPFGGVPDYPDPSLRLPTINGPDFLPLNDLLGSYDPSTGDQNEVVEAMHNSFSETDSNPLKKPRFPPLIYFIF